MDTTYSPKQFGQLIERSVNPLPKWGRKGILTAHRSPTNRRYYTYDQYLAYRGLLAQEQGRVIVYAQVSSAGQKPDLANQMAALQAYCATHGHQPDEWIEEIGSGLNYQRKRFSALMEQIELGQVRQLSIAHKELSIAHQDRLVRFGCEWVCSVLRATWHGTTHGERRHALAGTRIGARPALDCPRV